MNTVRPTNLDLFQIRLPVPALVSILHRLSGAILFLLLPLLTWTCRPIALSPTPGTMRRTSDSTISKIRIAYSAAIR